MNIFSYIFTFVDAILIEKLLKIIIKNPDQSLNYEKE